LAPRVRIGELLVDAGLISQDQLDRALEAQRVEGGGSQRLGQVIVALGFVTEGQFARVLSQQLAVPWVSLSHIDFSPTLLQLVDRQMAEKYTVIPVYIRRERRDVDTLYLAMDDPTQDDVLRIVSDRTKMPVRPMIAPPSDIIHAIIRAYGPKDDFEDEPHSALFPLPLVRRPSQPRITPTPSSPQSSPRPGPPPRPTPMPQASPSLPTLTPDQPIERPTVKQIASPARDDSFTEEPTVVKPAEAEQPRADETVSSPAEETRSPRVEEPLVAPAEAPVTAPAANHTAANPAPAAPSSGDTAAEKPATSKPKQPKMISLTLLDGTTIQLPSSRHRAKTKHASTNDQSEAFDEPKTVTQAVRRDSQQAAESIVATLRAATRDLNPAARATRWEGVVGALIEALIEKGALTEGELRAALDRKR
jgi:type IV pilus assembly protein PilB